MNEQQKTAHDEVNLARQEMEDLDREIEEELANVKKRLDELQSQKRASRVAFDEAWKRFEATLGDGK